MSKWISLQELASVVAAFGAVGLYGLLERLHESYPITAHSSADGRMLHELLPLQHSRQNAVRAAERTKRVQGLLGVPLAPRFELSRVIELLDPSVIRGGAWNGSYASWLRPSFRYAQAPGALSHGIGFRCALSLGAPAREQEGLE